MRDVLRDKGALKCHRTGDLCDVRKSNATAIGNEGAKRLNQTSEDPADRANLTRIVINGQRQGTNVPCTPLSALTSCDVILRVMHYMLLPSVISPLVILGVGFCG